MKFLYDMHVHTSPSSICAKVRADKVIEIYKKAKFSGIVVTNHLTKKPTDIKDYTWEKHIDQYLSYYEEVKNIGQDNGIQVFLGFEIHNREVKNDILIYNADVAMLYENENLLDLSQKELFDITNKYGGFMVAAHPFRRKIGLTNPEYVHGWEGYNMNPRHLIHAHNKISLKFAKKHNLVALCSTDFHRHYDKPCGIVLPCKCKDYEDLMNFVKNNEFKFYLRYRTKNP